MSHFAIGRGRGRPALRRGGEGRQGDGDNQQGQKQGGNGYLFGVHDGTDPFFQRVAAEGVGERQNSRARFLHAQKRGGIGAAFFLPAAAQHARVAAEFDIAVGEDRHGPHEGVEPVQADSHGDEQLPDGVEMADVGKFMLQRAQKRPRVGLAGALGQEDDRAQNAAGHRRVDARAQAHVHRAAQGLPFQPCAQERAVEGGGALKAAQAARVGKAQKQQQQQGDGQPDARERWHRAGFGRGDGRRLRRSGCLRRDGDRRRLRRDGRERRLPLRGLLHHDAGRPLRGGLFPAREHAQGRGGEHRQQQAQKREHPQPEKQRLGQAVQQQRPQYNDDQYETASREAHFQKRGKHILPQSRSRSIVHARKTFIPAARARKGRWTRRSPLPFPASSAARVTRLLRSSRAGA